MFGPAILGADIEVLGECLLLPLDPLLSVITVGVRLDERFGTRLLLSALPTCVKSTAFATCIGLAEATDNALSLHMTCRGWGNPDSHSLVLVDCSTRPLQRRQSGVTGSLAATAVKQRAGAWGI